MSRRTHHHRLAESLRSTGRLALVAGIASVALLAIRGERGPLASAADTLAATQPAQDISPAATAATRPATAERSFDEASFAEVKGKPGFWRIARSRDDVWWFVSPEDKLEFLNTVTTVQPYQQGRRPIGPNYSSRDWNGGFDMASGDLRTWADKTLVRVRDAGFKGLGAWCNPVFHQLDVPITRDLNLWAHADGGHMLFYNPQWREIVADAVKRQVVPLASNKHLVGYYTDNELDWSDSGAGPARYFNGLPETDPNKQKVMAAIKAIWPTIEAYNEEWETKYESFDALGASAVLSHSRPKAYGKLLDAFTQQLASDYHALTSELIRASDPNHLILGMRFKGQTTAPVVRGAAGKTDAVSLNYYVSDGKIDPDMFPMIARESKQPLIITEYSFHALDGHSGNRNTFGFDAQVLDQQARADGYRLFTQRLARTPYVIGADWFQWSDEPPTGRATDGEDVNFGVVDVDDNLYAGLADSIRATTPTLNPLHATSASDLGQDVLRERFGERVRMDAPHLDRPIRIDGELSDWPDATLLKGIRHGETIGLDRSPLPLPNIRVGWTEQGLYFAAEVFDQDIEGAPANGWWWTRDCLEFFISSKKAEPNQTFYTPDDQQFFFVPNAFPGEDGASGQVGQWHRNGDALERSLIPHPSIRQVARVFPDRYVVEMFIPAAAIHGFDPTGNTLMGLNVHVRNFQSAIDYFWSAPKEVMTQFRPGTWGELKLVAAAANTMANTQ